VTLAELVKQLHMLPNFGDLQDKPVYVSVSNHDGSDELRSIEIYSAGGMIVLSDDDKVTK